MQPAQFVTSLQAELVLPDRPRVWYQVVPARRQWRLVRELVFESVVAQRTIVVPMGFVTDGASVPWLPVIYWLTGVGLSAASVVHDYLYRVVPILVGKSIADAVYVEAMAAEGIDPVWQQWLHGQGVRWGGGPSWAVKHQQQAVFRVERVVPVESP